MDLTNFYYSNKSERFRLTGSLLFNADQEELIDDAEISEQGEDAVVGFIGLDAWDLPYHELISAGHSDLIMEISPSLHEQQKLLSQEESVMKMISPMYYFRREYLQLSEKVEVFLNWCFKKVSIHKQAIVQGLTSAQIKNIIYEYRVLSKIVN